jgi:methionyl-tRNA synthetase
VDGEKMAKSKGTQITASTYLKHLDPSFLRYYYASKLGPRLDDIDLNLTEFVNKVNSDLIGKVINLASRTARFIETVGLSSNYPDDGGLFQEFAQAGEKIAQSYEQLDYARATRTIMELADKANAYVENNAPWSLKKDPERQQELQDVCTVVLNLFRQLCIYLTPILPRLSTQCSELLQSPIQSWVDSQTALVGSPISKFQHLMQRLLPEKVQMMIEESKPEVPAAAVAPEQVAAPTSALVDSGDALAAEPLAPTCTIEDFAKVDLRVARVIKAEEVPEARKLIKLTVSLGGDNTRTVFAGIKAAYTPDQLVGRLVVIVANLQPRQMKFGLSEGMVTAAGAGGTEVFLLGVDSGAVPGHRVH